jgi:hypothetical protein
MKKSIFLALGLWGIWVVLASGAGYDGTSGGGLTVGGTISGGTDTRVLFNDAGTLGEDAGFTITKGSSTLKLGYWDWDPWPGTLEADVVKGHGGSGLNKYGDDLNLYGGISTGNQTGGDVVLIVAPPGGSGSSANTTTNGLVVDCCNSSAPYASISIPDQTSANSIWIHQSGSPGTITWEGSTANTIETRLGVTNPTSGDQLYLLPDLGAAGTYTLTTESGSHQITGSWTFTNTINGSVSGNAGTAGSTTELLSPGNATHLDVTDDTATTGIRLYSASAIEFRTTAAKSLAIGTNSVDRMTFGASGGIAVGGSTVNSSIPLLSDGGTTQNTVGQLGSTVSVNNYNMGLRLANTSTGASVDERINMVAGTADAGIILTGSGVAQSTGGYGTGKGRLTIYDAQEGLTFASNGGSYSSTSGVRFTSRYATLDRTRLEIFETPVTLTDALTNILSIAMTENGIVGGEILYTIRANDATDYQVMQGRVQFTAVNKAGTVTCTVGTDTQTTTLSSGTLTNAWSCAASGGNVILKSTPAGSLTETTYVMFLEVHMGGMPTATAPY